MYDYFLQPFLSNLDWAILIALWDSYTVPPTNQIYRIMDILSDTHGTKSIFHISKVFWRHVFIIF